LTYSVRSHRRPLRRRPPRRPPFLVFGILLVVVLMFGVLGMGTVATNAFGAGDLFERLVAKVERVIAGPVPDRSTRPTVTVTAIPRATPTLPGTGATLTPTQVARTPVDVTIADDPEAVFAHEIRKDWCAPAGVQMTLAFLGKADTSEAFQRALASRVREWESHEDSHNGEWGPAAMALALEAYGAPGYEIRAYRSRGEAVRDAAIAITETQSPAILLAWRGAHTWVMTGYRADADPTVFPDAEMTGTYILDPWYPWNSSIWGQSDPPGAFQDWPEMERNFLPWKRPEGKYPDRDGKFIILVPTITVSASR
jgi:hypothetical protein